MSDPESSSPENFLQGKRVAFVGKLGGVTKREAHKLVRERGGQPVDRVSSNVHLVVIGADELPLGEEDLLDEEVCQASAQSQLEIISETQFWQRLGLFQGAAAQLYTPAMLAELLNVPVSVVRRWHRRKLIVPVREVQRLPYFDFQEVATARQLAQLLAAGASPAEIERKLAELSRFVPDVERPLAQLSVIVEGKLLLLRQGEGLIEPGGQLRIDFEALEEDAAKELPDEEPATLPLPTDLTGASSPEELTWMAIEFEEQGQLAGAADLYRAAMAASGPQAELCFGVAELLYRLGDLSAARERYFMAIELDEDYVEARANLGCVLAELGQKDLAIAAFQGALSHHRDYPDAHYHLARLLDEMQQPEEAEEHWAEFLLLAPDSPWSDEARERLRDGKP
jgi:tetratricopeptide (TPR) repeat protein